MARRNPSTVVIEESPAAPGATDQDADLIDVLDQLGETAGACVHVYRLAPTGKQYIAKVAAEEFNLHTLAVEYGRGDYELRFHRDGSRGMVRSPKRYTVGMEFGLGTKRTEAPAPAQASPAPAAGSDFMREMLLLVMKQGHDAMIAQQAQTSALLTAVLSKSSDTDPLRLVEVLSKRTPANELIDSFKAFRELAGDAPEAGEPDTLGSIVKALPALTQLLADAQRNQQPPGGPPMHVRRQQPPRLAPTAAPAPVAPPPPPPPAAPPTQEAIIASVIAMLTDTMRRMETGQKVQAFGVAQAFVDAFSEEGIAAMVNSSKDGALTQSVIDAAPQLGAIGDFIYDVENLLRAQYELPGDDDDQEGEDDAGGRVDDNSADVELPKPAPSAPESPE